MLFAINKLNVSNLRGDLLGGLTAAIVSLPMALTFGIASGVGAEAGLYGAILIGLFAALFGGTSTLISEPTGPMTVVMASVVAGLIAANPDNGLAMAFTVVMMAGFFQILFGALKLGKYITLMPYSVVSGFMSGIGVILIILQLAPALGQAPPSGGVIGMMLNLPSILAATDFYELAIFSITVACLFFTPRSISMRFPPQLLALVSISVLAAIISQSNPGIDIRVIGQIDVGIPSFTLPSFSLLQVQTMLIDAMVLGMLGCIDSMLTSVIADNLTRTEHDSNKELIGQGLGNIVSGMFGGLPGAGATMGTVVNIQAGGKTPLSGVARVAILIVAVYGLADLIQHIPLAVLAAIALKVGFDILDWSFMKRAHRVSSQSTMIMYGVLFLTVFVDLIVAVGIGVFIANILAIERLSKVAENNIMAMSDVDDKLPLNAEQRDLLEKQNGRTLFFYLSGTMIFGVSKALAREHKNIAKHDVVIFDLEDVQLIDATIRLSIENMISEALELNKGVFVVIKTERVRKAMA
ncbi:MAG TPA: SulP family inorganic anion transporter, partial [Pseudomonadales bacterium]|nr:SulP family inorganic anion transporter [Pseudomonadales bacterium]